MGDVDAKISSKSGGLRVVGIRLGTAGAASAGGTIPCPKCGGTSCPCHLGSHRVRGGRRRDRTCSACRHAFTTFEPASGGKERLAQDAGE